MDVFQICLREIPGRFPDLFHMAHRISKRIYTQAALEFWFQCLTSDWERFFSPQVLIAGREIYRKGEIRELELRPGDAIVFSKTKNREFYSLLEWEEGRPAIRSSTRDPLLGNSLAAAGLYEIEELVSDEIPPVPWEKTEIREKRDSPKEDSEEDGKKIARDFPAGAGERQLFLKFTSLRQGLSFDAFWLARDRPPQPALFHGKRSSHDLSSAEREQLIQLTAVARKAGFHFWSHKQSYVLREISLLDSFFRHQLPRWKAHFKVEMDHEAKTLGKGVQAVRLEIEAGENTDGLAFKWIFKSGAGVIAGDQAQWLLRHPSKTVIIPSLGLLKLEAGAASFLEDWNSFLLLNGDAFIPRYMLFSLFGKDEIPFRLSPGLKKWNWQLLHPSPLALGDPGVLRPYQVEGVQWLARLCDAQCHALLADEMGLGKTIQVAALIAFRPLPERSHLIVCPASVVPVWKNEISKFYPHLRVEILKAGHTFEDVPEPAVWLASYTQLRRRKRLLEDREFGYAVLDEAQFIKNPDAKVTHACMDIRARHRFVLTGTPLENRHLDLWTLFRFLMPGLLGGRRRFLESLEKEGRGFLEKLNRQIAPFVLRRTKKEVVRELPPKLEMELVCPLTELQEREYSRITEHGVAALGEDFTSALKRRPFSFFTLLTRLRQVCCDPDLLPWLKADLEQSGKLHFLFDKVEEGLWGGHKIVIFSQFVSLLKRVRKGLDNRFPGTPVFELTGKTVNRSKPVAEFQKCEDSCLILVSLRAGGTGITLHAADYVFILDPWWNPAVEEQAIDRVHRIGQENPVFIYRMVTEGTIEERIEKLKANKREIFDQVIGGLNDISNFKNHFHSLSELISLQSGNS